MTPASIEQNRSRIEPWLTAGVALIVAGFCAATLARSFENSASLWRGILHDRNGHFQAGFDLALDLRSFDLLAALAQLERAKVWPPVHDLVLATVLLLGGPDHRLGILPSLTGWAATAMLTWLIACRLDADSIARVTAGAVAVAFVLGSPAFRLLGADVMLEGLGSALTAFALYTYLRCAEAPGEPRLWRIFALSLTLLFFEKSIYWEMTAAALALAYVHEHRPKWRVPAFADVKLWFGAFTFGMLRDPLVLTFVAITAVVIATYVHGPLEIALLGSHASLYPPENLVTVAYSLMFWRVALAWRRHRASWNEWLGIPGRAILYWHILPIAVTFLLPKRLSAFLWFVGPFNVPATSRYDPWAAAQFQWTGFAQGFHVAPWAGLLALILAAVGAGMLPRSAPGGRAVAILALLSAAAVIFHPQQQWRFQASWLFALLICAGIGAASLLGWLSFPLPARLRVLAACGAVALFVAAQAAAPISQVAYAAAIQSIAGPSDLDLVAAYLPLVGAGEPVAFVGSLTRNPFFIWTVHERCRCRAVVEQPWLDLANSRAETRRLAAEWLARTSVRRIVVIDLPDAYPSSALARERIAGIMDAMENQTRFVSGAKIAVPSFSAEVSLWQLRSGTENP